jgi:hypothetical protein
MKRKEHFEGGCSKPESNSDRLEQALTLAKIRELNSRAAKDRQEIMESNNHLYGGQKSSH